jgi:type IV pilus biogenesis protein CpaD/CtpE
MKTRHALLAVAVTAALSLVACGSDDKSSSSEEQATPAQAVTEIGTVEGALDTALTQVKSGDRAAAEETVSQAYVDHFEKVEGPLGKADPELNEKLEDAISGELRDKIKSGASAAQVEALVTQIKADLATAKAKLKA